MFRDTVSKKDKDLVFEIRDLVRSSILPRAIEFDLRGNDQFDWSAIEILAQHNLLAPTISPDYGGRGFSVLTTAMILEEIAAGCAGVATVVAANLHAISPLLVAGTEEQRRRYLPVLTDCQPKLGAVALVEHGSNLDIMAHTQNFDIRGSSLKAKSQGNRSAVISGHKDYVMNAAVADFMTALVQRPIDAGGETSGIQLVVLPMDNPGIKLGNIRHKLGLRYCKTAEVLFDEVTIDEQNMVGNAEDGIELFKNCLYRSIPYIGAICLGVARAAYQHALETSKARLISGRPVFEESTVSHALVDMASKLNAARLSVHRACWTIDEGKNCALTSLRAKIISSSVAQEITSRSLEIVGGKAYVRGSYAEKFLRDAKMLSIIDGSEHFHRCLLASQL